MLHATNTPSSRRAGLALLCVLTILVAWAAPVIVPACGAPEFLAPNQDQPGSDPVEAPTEIDDASDDPIALATGSQAGNLPLTDTCQPQTLIDRAWSPTALVRPPNSLNSI